MEVAVRSRGVQIDGIIRPDGDGDLRDGRYRIENGRRFWCTKLPSLFSSSSPPGHNSPCHVLSFSLNIMMLYTSSSPLVRNRQRSNSLPAGPLRTRAFSEPDDDPSLRPPWNPPTPPTFGDAPHTPPQIAFNPTTASPGDCREEVIGEERYGPTVNAVSTVMIGFKLLSNHR